MVNVLSQLQNCSPSMRSEFFLTVLTLLIVLSEFYYKTLLQIYISDKPPIIESKLD